MAWHSLPARPSARSPRCSWPRSLDANRATSFAAFYFASGIATLLASLGAGLLWDRHGADATFLAGAAVAVVAMAMLSLLPEDRSGGAAATTASSQ